MNTKEEFKAKWKLSARIENVSFVEKLMEGIL
mgnify:CR=1 FL=1